MKSTLENVAEIIGAHYDSFDQMYKAIQRFVSQSASDREQMRVHLQEVGDEPDAEKALRLGVAAYLLGQMEHALVMFKAAPEGKEKRWMMTIVYKELRDYDKALADLERAQSRGWNDAEARAEYVEIHRLMGDFKAAKADLEQLRRHAGDTTYYFYQAGCMAEAEGKAQSAIDLLRQAVEKDPTYLPALFRLAFLLDLNGDEERAVEFYRQCLRYNPVHVNAMMNLAVLYEDAGRYEYAQILLEHILQVYPNHPRANLFLKDVESSLSMFYDEEYERKRDKFQQVLDMPISDFELSVRSRNCLKKMGIKTLGDLTRITEAELLSYKNFGETSLNEIKAILSSKGLRLGQAVEDKASKKAAAMLPAGPSLGPSADQAILGKSIDDMQFSVRSKKCLQKLNVNTVGDLVDYSEAQLMAVKNFGSVSLKEVKEKLTAMGLSLRQSDV